ncbi:hypothetical protein H4F83_08855 [Citrobacter freundii]|nr:hypothetical protein [Citrobacter freundii]
MTALNKQALREELEICSKDRMRRLALSLLDELEAKDVALSSKDYHFDQDAGRIKSLEKALESAENRIAELEARTVMLPADNAAESESSEDDATAWFDEGWNARGRADKEALIAAGIGVKGE